MKHSRRFAKTLAAVFIAFTLATSVCSGQSLPTKWEDLTSADFVKALKQSGGVCMLPIGSLEKFGPSGPIGTNLYLARLVALEAAKKEYAIVFPDYFASVTASTSTLPGTVAYSQHLILELLDETTREMARNGCKKILLVNGHSSNTSMIAFFLASLMQTPHDYTVYSIYGPEFPVFAAQYAKLPPEMQPSKPGVDGHGGEERISAMLAYYPDLVHLDRAHDEPTTVGHGTATEGQAPKHIGSGFMDSLPTGYDGDAAGATATRGKALVQYCVDRLVKVIKDVKSDNTTPNVEKDFSKVRETPANPK
jgi:creatinine amidohydrolase